MRSPPVNFPVVRDCMQELFPPTISPRQAGSLSHLTLPFTFRLRSNSPSSWVFMKANLTRVVRSLCGYYKHQVGLVLDSVRLPDLGRLGRRGGREEVDSLIRLVLGVAVTCQLRGRHITLILSQEPQVAGIVIFMTPPASTSPDISVSDKCDWVVFCMESEAAHDK